MEINKKKIIHKDVFIGLILGLLVISIPLTVFILQKSQESRSRATAATTLSFMPASTQTSPLQFTVNDSFILNPTINPGTNLVTLVKLEITYDPSKLAPNGANSFAPNTAAFPVITQQPIYSPGVIQVIMEIGSNPTNAIQTTTSLGTISFNALSPTTSGTPTQVVYTTTSEVLSLGSNDQAAENVLSSTTPAFIEINSPIPTPTNTPVPTLTPTPTLLPTNTPTPTPTSTPIPTDTPFPTSTPVPLSTVLNFTVFLHGIGNSGDNANPNTFSLSNHNPLHPERNLSVEIYDKTNQFVSSSSGTLVFDANAGNFSASIDMGTAFLTGDYNIYIKSDKYLKKLIPGIQKITAGQTNTAVVTTLIAGDINDDNTLDILDYNALLDCGYGEITSLPMTDPNSVFNSAMCQAHQPYTINTDLNDDGIIDATDFNLFIRELSVQNGD